MRLDEFRNELPFGDDELRAIREQVMNRIAQKPRRGPAWLGMFLRASLVAAALVLLVVRPMRENVPVVVPLATHTPLVVARAPIVTPPTEHPLPRPKRVSRRPRPIEHTEPPPASAESAPAPVRIELQTSNPDIRILWIANPSGETR
jgi:hypothetical protein